MIVLTLGNFGALELFWEWVLGKKCALCFNWLSSWFCLIGCYSYGFIFMPFVLFLLFFLYLSKKNRRQKKTKKNDKRKKKKKKVNKRLLRQRGLELVVVDFGVDFAYFLLIPHCSSIPLVLATFPYFYPTLSLAPLQP